jgi:hypothetical protein
MSITFVGTNPGGCGKQSFKGVLSRGISPGPEGFLDSQMGPYKSENLPQSLGRRIVPGKSFIRLY